MTHISHYEPPPSAQGSPSGQRRTGATASRRGVDRTRMYHVGNRNSSYSTVYSTEIPSTVQGYSTESTRSALRGASCSSVFTYSLSGGSGTITQKVLRTVIKHEEIASTSHLPQLPTRAVGTALFRACRAGETAAAAGAWPRALWKASAAASTCSTPNDPLAHRPGQVLHRCTPPHRGETQASAPMPTARRPAHRRASCI